MELTFKAYNPSHMYAGTYAEQYKEATRLAEIEHAPGIAVRMNPRTFRTEYYNIETGEIVSSHI